MISCLPMASSYCISSIHFSLIIFNISCRASILVMNSLHFYFFGNVLISPFLKDSFIWYWIFGWQSISNISSSYFLISWFLMRFQLLMLKISYDKLLFPCWLKILFVLSLNSMTMTYLGMHLFEFTVFGINWASWKCRIMFFIKFGTFGAIKKNTFFMYFTLSFPLGLLIHVC